ncbi:hypothetical protein [Lacticaseibacillus absianus]|uniref:hypothetical protein n=1 Tax=Lacticaseibacillus absianus TaxID=2729623 RepID=UPI0015C95811|nr:hypothetical protein [Lacticaseibacillus absianus]
MIVVLVIVFALSALIVERELLPAVVLRLSGFRTILLSVAVIAVSILVTLPWSIRYVVVPAVTIFMSLLMIHKFNRIKSLHPEGSKRP